MKNTWLLVILFLLSTAIADGQERLRTVEQRYPAPNAPIEIVGWEKGGVPFLNKTQVYGDKNWWHDLTATVKNISSKNISIIRMDLLIEKQGAMRAMMGMSLMRKDLWEKILDEKGVPTGKRRLRTLAPGEISKISVHDFVPQRVAKQLGDLGITEIDRLTFTIESVNYDDGTFWSKIGRELKFKSSHSPDPSQKKISVTRSAINAPIEIIKINTNGIDIHSGQIFSLKGEWLQDLSIEFTSRSDRPIKTVTFYLIVYESKPIDHPSAFPIGYGFSPGKREANQPFVLIDPGSGGTATISDWAFKSLKRSSSFREELSLLNTAEIRIDEVHFSDGTKWANGSYYKPDASQPGGYIVDREASKKSPLKSPVDE